MKLCWGRRVSKEFRTKLLELCRSSGWTEDHANWLMACMAFESAETFSSSVKNGAGSGAVGLIQFMPNTAKSLGTNSQALGAMTPEQQLVFVFRYFEPYKKKIKSLSDMYMAILSPVYISSPDSTPLFSGGIAYRQNAGLDANRDGKVTKAEASAKVAAKLTKGMSWATEED